MGQQSVKALGLGKLDTQHVIQEHQDSLGGGWSRWEGRPASVSALESDPLPVMVCVCVCVCVRVCVCVVCVYVCMCCACVCVCVYAYVVCVPMAMYSPSC